MFFIGGTEGGLEGGHKRGLSRLHFESGFAPTCELLVAAIAMSAII
jgi:hypothetical protein